MIADGPVAPPDDLVSGLEPNGYRALLGYPPGSSPEGRSAELVNEARDWLGRNARPWAQVRAIAIERLEGPTAHLASGHSLSSAELVHRIEEAGARAVVAALVSAGSEIDRSVDSLWLAERPDEAYVLDRLGAAVAIRLGGWLAVHLRDRAAASALALGPGYSPGYDGWDLTDQPILASALFGADDPPFGFRVLDSGMLEPKNSLMALFSLGTDSETVERAWSRHPCSWCSSDACALRGRQRP